MKWLKQAWLPKKLRRIQQGLSGTNIFHEPCAYILQ